MDIGKRIGEAARRQGSTSWQPHLFDLSSGTDRTALEKIFADGEPLQVCDTIEAQLHDLIRAGEPAKAFSGDELEEKVRDIVAGGPLVEYGRWAFYPWSRRLVHVLPEAAFRRLRSDRNRYKITSEEQDRLRSFCIGIVGLSVGLSVALTLALEGVGGRFRLADFDTLGLSNLNRLRAGVGDLGFNKAVLAARQMFEIDPYLDIAIFPDGIHENNLEVFFTGGGKLDLLIEECDDLYVKVRLRETARRLRIPVVMDTSDRGLIDVERFDREPGRPPFHGLAGPIRAEDLKGLPTKEKVPFVLAILDAPRLSPALRASMVEIQETLETWPQLGSSVTLGGAITADAVRRILLGQFHESGRYYVDAEDLVRDGAGVTLPDPLGDCPAPHPEALRPLQTPSRPPIPIDGSISLEEARYLVAYGIMAPSAGNTQPWRFVWKGGQLLALRVPQVIPTMLDFEDRAVHLGFGAVAANMELAAGDLGLSVAVEFIPDSDDPFLVFRMSPSRCPTALAEPSISRQMPLRVTNRKLGPRKPLVAEDRAALERAASAGGARLHLLTRPEELDDLGGIIGRGDRLRFLTEVLHREMMSEIRWTPEEVAATRDGVDLASIELSAADRSAIRVISDWKVMAHLRRIREGRALEQPGRKAIAAATAVCLLTTEGTGPDAYFRGGRALQRVWLTASSRGLSLQPMSILPYLFARLEAGGEGLAEEERQTLSGLRGEYLRWFPLPRGHAELLLFRLSTAGPPTARSLRKHLDDVFSVEGAG